MDTAPVPMGGILDLATTQSDDIFNITSNKIDASESHKETTMFQENHSSHSRYPELWRDSCDDFSNVALTKNSPTKDEASNDVLFKPTSPDILSFESKQTSIASKNELTDLQLQTSGAMISSICSSLAETPGDSGVLCLDSETSELTSECPVGMTLSLVEADELTCDATSLADMKYSQDGEVKSPINVLKVLDDDVMTQSDIENQNITPPTHDYDVNQSLQYFAKRSNKAKHHNENEENLPDLLKATNGAEKSLESKYATLQKTPAFESYSEQTSPTSSNNVGMTETMKSASDDIVYRRKCKKKPSNQSQPKKRVSFHEDILNSTKTDNIHIEHGFISYRPEASMNYFTGNYLKKQNPTINRYSWCAVGDGPYIDSQQALGRNTRSDVLTYGRTDVNGYPDNSGVYEYQTDDRYLQKNINKVLCDSESCVNKVSVCKCSREDTQRAQYSPVERRQLYMCSCSSSDSNLSTESETSSSQTLSFGSDTNVKFNSGKPDNTQKSYSCDCIENNIMRPMMKTMYFSDADINNHSELNKDEEQLQMSEVLPKASCLKKSSLKKKRYIKTDIIEEHDPSKIKVENTTSMRNLLDSKNLFGSLKSIYKTINFGLTIAERGVPEGSEDCQSVLEVLPTESAAKSGSSFLSKSFDDGFDDNFKVNRNNEVRIRGDGYSRKFTHEVDDQLRRRSNQANDSHMPLAVEAKIQSDVSKQSLTLNMKADNGKTFLDWKHQNNLLSSNDGVEKMELLRNKYIVNCESTVYEHKGVSYSYEYDTFQTTFDTSKDTFTPIHDNNKLVMAHGDCGTKDLKENISTTSENLINSVANDLVKDQFENESKISVDLGSESDIQAESGDKSKFKLTKYLLEQNENAKLGMSKHLSSPLKQKNVMRYEKFSKTIFDNQKETDTLYDSSSIQDTVNEIMDLDETLEITDGLEFQNKSINRKTSLINRFLKNVCQKKALESKLQQNSFFQQKLKEETLKFPNICYPLNEAISPTFKVAAKYIDSLINKEVMENKRVSVKLMTADEPSYFDSFEENVAIECCEKLKLELFGDSSEILHRMLKVRSVYSQDNGQWSPLLVFITDRALYVADVEVGLTTYNLRCYLTHDQLDVIVIGPDSQYVQIFDNTGECRCILITGDRYLCHRLVSSLEWSSRNSRVVIGPTTTLGSIPSIIWKKRDCLKKELLKTTSVDKNEYSLFYGMVGSSSPTFGNMGRPASPFGPPLEGFLMYKTEKSKYWRPSFFLLKSGILSYGTTTPPTENLTASCLPHSIQLDSVLGVRRCTDLQGRPHCFEIALGGTVGGSLQMAAPDDDTASQWLQGLLMHASQALEGPKTDVSKKCLPPCCTLLATSGHIITLREELKIFKSLMDSDVTIKNENLVEEPAQNGKLYWPQPPKSNIEILSCASINDLTAFKIPDNDDNWCILEFVFCEVREGTLMGFLFGSSAELERFIATVESLWHKTNDGVFPISILPKSEAVSGKCSEWHNCYVTAWDRMLPTAQR